MASNAVVIISMLKMKEVIDRLSYGIRLLQNRHFLALTRTTLSPLEGHKRLLMLEDRNGAKSSATHVH
jgi:hypothetical protein